MPCECTRLALTGYAAQNHVRFIAAALLIILCTHFACSAALVLSGEWESAFTVEPQTHSWSMETDLTISVRFEDWTMEARSVFDDGAWKKQDYGIEATLGELSVESDLRFEPHKDRFKDWITEVEWETDRLIVTLTTKLTRSTDWLICEFEHEDNSFEIDARIRFRSPSGSCRSAFYDARTTLDFDWCGIETEIEASIDDDGFDEIVLELSEFTVSPVPWVTFDLEIARTTETTSLKLSPDVVLYGIWGSGACELEIEGDFPESRSLYALAVIEAVLTWEVNDWELEATAILDPSSWISKTYWLKVRADAEFDFSYCGELSLESTFLWTEAALCRSLFVMSYNPCNPLSITIEADYDLLNAEIDTLALKMELAW